MIVFDVKKDRPILVACVVLASLILFFGLAFASEGGSHAGADDSKRLLDLGYRFINFALLVIILFIVVRKTAIKDFFSNRREAIKKKFDNLKVERDEAESRFQELEKKLKKFEIEKEKIIEQYVAEGIQEKGKIISEAEERAKQILEQTDLTIEREIEAAGNRIKQEVMNIAAHKAQEIIAKEIKESDQDNLVDEFIKSVEKLH